MKEAKTIYQRSRPAAWPAPEGTKITVTAKVDNGDVVGISWERDDLIEKGGLPSQVTLTAAEFQAIAAAVAAHGDPWASPFPADAAEESSTEDEEQPRSKDAIGSVAGRACIRCGFDEASTQFPFIGAGVIPEYDAEYFCNSCGTVYNEAGSENIEATRRFRELGRPGFTGR